LKLWTILLPKLALWVGVIAGKKFLTWAKSDSAVSVVPKPIATAIGSFNNSLEKVPPSLIAALAATKRLPSVPRTLSRGVILTSMVVVIGTKRAGAIAKTGDQVDGSG
jgi:hypothetical protein